MSRANRILAIIPARGGSRGIPRKNIRSFAGKPLIAHTIAAAQRAPSLDRIAVSTDSKEIAAAAQEYGAQVPYLRPKRLATSTSRAVDALVHLLEWLQAHEQYEPTHILVLQPTNPMRTSADIEKAIALFFERKADTLVSVCRTENLLFTKDARDRLKLLNPTLLSSPNRQQLPTYYKLDGSMIYMATTRLFRSTRSFFAGTLVGYEIERWRAVDLDEPQDFIAGEILFRRRDDIEKRIKLFV